MTKLQRERLELLKEKERLSRDECSHAFNKTFSWLAKNKIINQTVDKQTGIVFWEYKKDDKEINEVKFFHKNKYKKGLTNKK